jgi:ankyrin repeat protein
MPYASTRSLEQALCWAAQAGHTRTLSTLLEASVSPNACLSANVDSPTALMFSMNHLSEDCVHLLLQKGAATGAQSSFAHLRVHDAHTRFTHDHKYSVLHYFVISMGKCPCPRQRAQHILDMLLAAGADLEARDAAGNTPLLLSVSEGHRDYTDTTVPLLLSAGASMEALNGKGESLLHLTLSGGSTFHLARTLLESGADPNQRRLCDRATPIIW